VSKSNWEEAWVPIAHRLGGRSILGWILENPEGPPVFGVHEHYENAGYPWGVTHLPTGYNCSYHDSILDAKATAEGFMAMDFRWDKVTTAVRFPVKVKKAAKLIRAEHHGV